ncbi:MAG: PilZ domain-containing protein [Planctomycetes bacterium]|nr:PilZ domain-containing protein [Planctomycetota bacterium]
MTSDRKNRPERRRYPRSVVGIPVQAVLRNLPPEDPDRVVGLHVRDLSPAGAGAVAQRALLQRQPLVLFFPPLGAGRGDDTPGQVVRCEECGDHWSVGIAFEEVLSESEPISAN